MSASTDPLRDEYAGKALEGMLAKTDLSADKAAAAKTAFEYAVEMITAREALQPVAVPPSVSNPIGQVSPPATPPFVNDGNQTEQP